ncbi:MAG: STAS domain-containing protein [Limnothrix sp. RL_2_0]|nr:STAS domain-containing protein [Limnothrix sp. RL_2_0]
MKLESQTLENGIRVVKLEGKMDIQGVNQVGEEFGSTVEEAAKQIVVDMSAVSFMASLGMRTLMITARGINGKGGKMVLLQPQPLVKEALVTAGIDRLIPIYDDIETACSAL